MKGNMTRVAAVLGFGLIGAGTAAAATITLDANGGKDVANLKQIILALENYESANARFPAAYIGPLGTPLLSWRVAILPYLGYSTLFNQFDLTKPWNDPANLPLLSQMPAVFRSPLDSPSSTRTNYIGATDPNSMFPGAPGVTLISVSDGTSNTIFVGESSGSNIPWTKPEDLAVGSCPTLGDGGFSSFVSGAVPFAFVDGNVRFLPNTIDCNALRGLLLRNDGVINASMAIGYTVVPEPSTIRVLGVLLAGALLLRRREPR